MLFAYFLIHAFRIDFFSASYFLYFCKYTCNNLCRHPRPTKNCNNSKTCCICKNMAEHSTLVHT